MKVSFGEVLSESFDFFFAHLRLFFHLVTIPWIISLLLRIAGAALTEESLIVVLVEKALDVIPTVMFLVAWMRVVLLGPARIDWLPGLAWSPRETAFLIHLLKVAGITFLLIAAFTLIVGTIDPQPWAARDRSRTGPARGAGGAARHRSSSPPCWRRCSFGCRHRRRPAVHPAPLLGL